MNSGTITLVPKKQPSRLGDFRPTAYCSVSSISKALAKRVRKVLPDITVGDQSISIVHRG